jgi:hypothetical protein
MIRGIYRSAAAAGLAIAFATAAFAGPIADKASEAESLIGSGDAAGALGAFDAATEAFWEASPLQFRVATFADSISGFADFAARPDGTPFHPGDTMQIYLEPVGYGFATDGGATRASFSIGTEIRQGDVVLGKTDDLGKFAWQGTGKNYAIDATISMTLPALKPGDYTLLLTVTDDASGKSATTPLGFSIVE